MQLREDDIARTNIGIHNQWRRWAEVEVKLYDGNGSLITRHNRLIFPLQTVQLNRPFHTLGGRDDVVSGYAVVTVRSGQDIYVYGSVIDNATGDPTAIPMKNGIGASKQWIAAASHSSGANDSAWRTDVCLLNRSGGAATAGITFHSGSGDTGTLAVALADGEQMVIGDIVGQIGFDGSGSIEVKSEAPVMVSSRTYNSSGEGTFGLFLDGVSEPYTIGEGEVVWLSQLRQNMAFRSNIGLVNGGDIKARIRMTFFDAAGNELASKTRALDPGAWTQLLEPFSRLAGRDDIHSGYAIVEVISGNGVIAYATVIDNATNDGTAVAMKR